MSQTTRLELYIGAFVLAGVIIISGMIISMTGTTGLFADTYKVIVDIEHIGDLKAGAPVKLGGYPIGKVVDIQPGKSRLEITCDIDSKRDLPKDTEANITNSGLVGDTFLEFTQGKYREFLSKTEAPHIPGNGPVNMNQLFKRVEDIGVEVTGIVRNLNNIVADEEVQKNIKEAISNANITTRESQLLLASLRRSSDKVFTATQNVAETSEKIKRMAATMETTVNSTIGDKRNVDAFSEILANLKEVSGEGIKLTRQLSKVSGRVDTMLVEKEDAIKGTIQNVKDITDKAKEVTSAMGPDKGVMKLFTSDFIEKEVGDTFGQVQSIVAKVDKIMGDSLVNLLVHNKAADRIFNEWYKSYGRQYRSPEEMMRAWKQWSDEQSKLYGRFVDPKYPEGAPWERDSISGR